MTKIIKHTKEIQNLKIEFETMINCNYILKMQFKEKGSFHITPFSYFTDMIKHITFLHSQKANIFKFEIIKISE